MVRKQKIFHFKFSETLKGISNTLKSLKLVQLRIDEIAEGWSTPPPPLPLPLVYTVGPKYTTGQT